MQVQLRLLIIILGLSSFYCSVEKDKNSKVPVIKEYYENGSIKSEWEVIDLIDSIPNGKTIDYYPSGKIEFIMHFVDGVPNGPSEYFNESGMLMAKENILNDKRHGERIEYHESGNIQFQGKFHYGQPIGEHITYFDDTRKQIRQIKDYILHENKSILNTHIVYDSSGNVLDTTPTIKVDEEPGFLKIYVIDKEYKPLRLFHGRFDKYYVLESLDTMTINSNDNLSITVPFHKGDTLRGIIISYKPINSDSGVFWKTWLSYPKTWN